ncbi:cysteine synthase A [Selenihalanaerobacter shriftii]|uniref:Cysteine synthase n=1 Tax=Selenihalanaerobacter shriftii TaxID=142842 RepID=A0A1T4NIK8_9FIRM|nr:cysteine synthase A [Selenihalanaerobacter shriftii]SJZ78598.1 cysteine synthase [Selenihalanaerobacter shriftii]
MKVVDNILQLIGDTPIMKLNKIVDSNAADVYIKLELFNPSGSIKDRITLYMIESAELRGELKPGGTIVEPTSGNTGISLALVGISKGYEVILTMPDTVSIERKRLLEAYGVKLILTSGSGGMSGAVKKAKELIAKNPNYFMPNQFEDPVNSEAHKDITATEILKAMNQNIDAFVAGVGTGGTITGIGEALKESIDNIEIIAVEPAEAPILSDGISKPHIVQGIGVDFVPKVLNMNILDRIITVEKEEIIETVQRLAVEEGILVGISSGAAVAAAIKVAEELDREQKVVTMAFDNGERYLSTSLF